MFAEIIAGASGALRVQDLERGASSECEGIVFEDSDGDGGDFCGLWKQKNSRRKQLEGKVRELESEVLEQLHQEQLGGARSRVESGVTVLDLNASLRGWKNMREKACTSIQMPLRGQKLAAAAAAFVVAERLSRTPGTSDKR